MGQAEWKHDESDKCWSQERDDDDELQHESWCQKSGDRTRRIWIIVRSWQSKVSDYSHLYRHKWKGKGFFISWNKGGYLNDKCFLDSRQSITTIKWIPKTYPVEHGKVESSSLVQIFIIYCWNTKTSLFKFDANSTDFILENNRIVT